MVRVLLVGQLINEQLGEYTRCVAGGSARWYEWYREELQSAERARTSLRRQRFIGDGSLTNQGEGLV